MGEVYNSVIGFLASKWFQSLSAGFEWDGFDYAPSAAESRL